MSPLWDFRCEDGHVTERLLKSPVGKQPCETCGKDAERLLSVPHLAPDGVYSYAPNLGDPQAFDRKHEEARAKRNAA